MSTQGRAEKRRDEASKPNLVFPRGGVGRGAVCVGGREVPIPKNASKCGFASSTSDESGWESEVDVETDIESEMESEVGEDDDGFDADSEGEFGQSPVAKIASFDDDAATSFPGGSHFPSKPRISFNDYASSAVNGKSHSRPMTNFNKFFYVPSTGEFVALETDCENDTDDDEIDDDDDEEGSVSLDDTSIEHSFIGHDSLDIHGDLTDNHEDEGSDTEVEEGGHSRSADDALYATYEKATVAKQHNAIEPKSSNDTTASSSEVDSNSCPIVSAERNLSMLINVITETQQHLDEIFTKHNIPYDFSASGVDVGLSEEKEPVMVKEDSVSFSSPTSEGAVGANSVFGNQCMETMIKSEETLANAKPRFVGKGEEEEEDSAIKEAISPLTSDDDASIDASIDAESPDPDADEPFSVFDAQVKLFLAPSACLMSSLLALCILNFFNVVQVLSTAALVVIFASLVATTICHFYQVVFSKALENPFRAYLEKDLILVFSIFNPLISDVLLRGSSFLEVLKGAVLFGDRFDSLKLVLVTCSCCYVGQFFTVPRLVVSMNLFLFFSRPEMRTIAVFVLHRTKQYFFSVLKGFF